jgi:hypothetical protein
MKCTGRERSARIRGVRPLETVIPKEARERMRGENSSWRVAFARKNGDVAEATAASSPNLSVRWFVSIKRIA